MNLKHLFVGAFLLVAATATAQEMQMPAIPVDQNVKIGKLDNGLTYYIRQNNWPEKVVNFYIAQRVGSIQEEESQRGLAHFLEHMAFNGSEHFPDSTLLEYTRSLGVEFGGDLNAYTSIDQTVYRICDVPSARQTALDSCLLILKDWSNGLTLDSKEIDKERGVIHQEWQLSSSPQMRIYERILPKVYPNSKYGLRLPIGLMSVVDGFKYQELRDYYHKWYRPDNQAIIVVGDVDVDHMEAEIKRLWASSTVPANAAKVVAEPVPDNNEAIYIYDKDKEMSSVSVQLAMKHEIRPDSLKGNVDYLMESYLRDIFGTMLNQRFAEKMEQADCPFQYAIGGDGIFEFAKTKGALEVYGAAKDGKELETLGAYYREIERIRQHGFTAGEFNRAKAQLLSELESEYTNRNKTRNETYGDSYRDNFLFNEPIPSIEDKYQLLTQLAAVPYINVDVVNEMAKQFITPSDTNLVCVIMGKDGTADITPAQMAETIAKVRAEKIEPYVDNTKDEPLVDETKLPKAGKITKETENKELGYKELTLSNGARVILKKTDYQENNVQFQAMAAGGKSCYGAADFSNLKFFEVAMSASGRGNFSATELEKALAGKQASVNMGLSTYQATLSGNTLPKDIETLMQLVYLNFTAVSKDQSRYDTYKNIITEQLKNKYLTPEGVFRDSLQYIKLGHNERFAPIQASDVENANYDRMLEIAREQYNSPGQFVFYFIGNFDEATLRPLIEKYIACLPKGKVKKTAFIPTLRDGEHKEAFTKKSETPKAMSYDFWHAPLAYTAENKVLADAAGQYVEMVWLKSIREDEGAAYSVSAYGSLNRYRDTDHCQGEITLVVPMDPNKSEQALNLVVSGLKESIDNPEADKVQKIKEVMLKKYEQSVKNNAYWMDVIDEYVWTGVNLDKGYKAAIEALTPAQIAATLKTITGAGNHAQAVMTPGE